MVEWYKDLYLDGITGKFEAVVRDKIERERLQYPCFCIMLASNPNNLLDIINVNELLLPYYKKKKILILGLAASRNQGKTLAAHIIEEIYKETGGVDVRSYFTNKNR